MASAKQLVVLGCSATKVAVDGLLPAISLYDGPTYRVLRSYLREFRWPDELSVGVLSAKHGMIGGLSQIATYDQRMTANQAQMLSDDVSATLAEWGSTHQSVDFVLGQDYREAVDRPTVKREFGRVRFVKGAIGQKLSRLHDLLRKIGKSPRGQRRELRRMKRPLYFLPDWDDFIDPDYDYVTDSFSTDRRSERKEKHTIEVMRPKRLCDGILVSLAQHLGSKGLLRRVEPSDPASLAPRSVRTHFGLDDQQWAFGDCGAFSYVTEDEPAVSVEQAVSLYELYEFDLGASVDHIPVRQLPTDDGMESLSDYKRRKRLELTRDNAAAFLNVHRERGARFTPVGVVQGLGPKSYAHQIGDYLDMGYRHLAIGGLVPQSDEDIRQTVKAVNRELRKHTAQPWIHLLGIFRPTLQPYFREVGIGSFDSASYFRKAWLRSDQNYLGADGQWYAAIRVPPLRDPRTRARLDIKKSSEKAVKALEAAALKRLREYAARETTAAKALKAVVAYDKLLARGESTDDKLLIAYQRTLDARPWDACKCPVCRSLGIEALIFRGKNRNKSRGAHNTLMLYGTVIASNK